MIKNIVFDMGGVLIAFDNKLFVEREGIMDPGDQQNLLKEIFQCADWPLLDWGDIDEEELVRRVEPRVPERLRYAVHPLICNWSEPLVPVPGMADLIREYKEKGYHIYLLSNVSRRFHAFWNKVPGHEYFDGIIVSADEGVVKPLPEIYHRLLDRYGLNACESVFIDDFPGNVAGAIHIGMHGILFRDDMDELKRNLNKLLAE